MKNAPCVRFASRIRPKISEKPDESRNSKPPSERLLRPWMIQNCIVCPSSGKGATAAQGAGLLFQIFRRRPVARIDRILQECGLIVGPELADIGVVLDDGVDQPAIGPRHLADVAVAGGVAEFVKLD